MVKATFVDSFQNVQTVEVHSEAIEDERIRDLMTYVFVREPLIQVENMYKMQIVQWLEFLFLFCISNY